MRRRLFNIAATVSLVLCVAATIACCYSLRNEGDAQWVDQGEQRLHIHARAGVLQVVVGCTLLDNVILIDDYDGWHIRSFPIQGPSTIDWFSFGHDVGSRESYKWDGYIISFPLWLLALIFALSPMFALTHWWRSRSIAGNACRRCGYNLAGNVSGVCSECGTSIKS